MKTCEWALGDGTTLKFTIHDFNSRWTKVGGLYVFAYIDGNRWNALYVGQSNDFSSQLPSHELRDAGRQNGATHIHALTVRRPEKPG